jgi:hypothetical protein
LAEAHYNLVLPPRAAGPAVLALRHLKEYRRLAGWSRSDRTRSPLAVSTVDAVAETLTPATG